MFKTSVSISILILWFHSVTSMTDTILSRNEIVFTVLKLIKLGLQPRPLTIILTFINYNLF